MRYFENTEQKPAEMYYHYTSLEALYGIVTSKTFRLTSLKSSNDKKELYYKPEQFILDFSNVCSKEKDLNTKYCFQLIKKSVESNKQSFFNVCTERAFPYAMSLSEKKDNLTHWERYASGCTGVCIGFNISSLKAYAQRMTITPSGFGLYEFGKVFYSSEHRETYIRNDIVGMINILFGKGETIVSQEIIQKNGYLYAASACKQLMQFSKNSSFIDEDEIRLYHDATSVKAILHFIDSLALSEKSETNTESNIYEGLKKDFRELAKKLNLEEEKFCVTKNGIRSYRELCLKDVWGSETIPEIILGPMCMQSRNELKCFLKANGLQRTRILVSKVPIR